MNPSFICNIKCRKFKNKLGTSYDELSSTRELITTYKKNCSVTDYIKVDIQLANITKQDIFPLRFGQKKKKMDI